MIDLATEEVAALERVATEAAALERAVRSFVPRIALTLDEAAAALGISRDSFDRYVKPELPIVRKCRLKLVAVEKLERWVEESAKKVLE
jgi:hypothetical protein